MEGHKIYEYLSIYCAGVARASKVENQSNNHIMNPVLQTTRAFFWAYLFTAYNTWYIYLQATA